MCSECLLSFVVLFAGVGDATDGDDDVALLRNYILSVRQTELIKIFESVAEVDVTMMSERYLGDLIQMTQYAGFQSKENQDIKHKVS